MRDQREEKSAEMINAVKRRCRKGSCRCNDDWENGTSGDETL